MNLGLGFYSPFAASPFRRPIRLLNLDFPQQSRCDTAPSHLNPQWHKFCHTCEQFNPRNRRCLLLFCMLVRVTSPTAARYRHTQITRVLYWLLIALSLVMIFLRSSQYSHHTAQWAPSPGHLKCALFHVSYIANVHPFGLGTNLSKKNKTASKPSIRYMKVGQKMDSVEQSDVYIRANCIRASAPCH